ncbi:MAG: hypothetical protein ACYC3G_03025 [Minisyncoccota bacterium]
MRMEQACHPASLIRKCEKGRGVLSNNSTAIFFVKVWYAFTRVCDIRDMRLDVTFLELNVPVKRQERHETVIIPAVVAQGLTERAINRA